MSEPRYLLYRRADGRLTAHSPDCRDADDDDPRRGLPLLVIRNPEGLALEETMLWHSCLTDKETL